MSGMTSTLFPQLSCYMVSQIDPSLIRLTSQFSHVKHNYLSFSFTNSFIKLQSSRLLHCRLGTRETNNFTPSQKNKEERFFVEKIQVQSNSHSVDRFSNEEDKEIQRRRKIGLANKGKVPWNKGIKHSAETREKIKENTIKALNDPKVRKKMSEYPRSLSDQTKAKISVSARKLWSERLKWKRSREKFVEKWAESIAIAAKIGGIEQRELKWDYYEKQITRQKLKWAAEKAKKKALSQKKVKAKAEKMKKLAQKRKEQEEKAKIYTNKKSKEEKEDLIVDREFKLKERLTKIHKKKSMISRVSWEKFDIELIEGQEMQKEVSLEDQIRVAKNKRQVLVYSMRDHQ